MDELLQLLGIDPASLDGKPEEEKWKMVVDALKSKLGAAGDGAQTTQAVATALGLKDSDGKDKIIAAAKAAADASKSATKADEALKAVATELGCEPEADKLVAAVKGIKNMKPGDIDPTKFVAKEQYDAVVKAQESDRNEITKIKASMLERETADFIRKGEEDGKIVAATKDHWTETYRSNPESAVKHLANAPVIGPTTGRIAATGTVKDDPGGNAKDRKSIIASAKKEYQDEGHKTGVSAANWINDALTEKGESVLSKAESDAI